jgi:WD40 repeat protein
MMRRLIGGVFLCLVSQMILAQASQSGRIRFIPIVSDQRIEDIQESPDGTRLLTHDRMFAPRLWDAKSMRMLAILPHSERPVVQATMSDLGGLIVTNSGDEVRVWDAKSARLLASWNEFDIKDSFSAVRISHDDQQVVLVGSKSGKVFRSVAPFLMLAPVVDLPEANAAFDVAFSPDDKWIAVSQYENPLVTTVDLATKKVASIQAGGGGNLWLEFSADGRQLLVTGRDNRAHLLDLAAGQSVKSWEHVIGPKGERPNTFMASVFVGNGLNELVVCGASGVMSIYDRKTLALKRELTGAKYAIREIRKSRNGLKLGTYESFELDEGEPLKLWDVETGKEHPFNRAGGPTAGNFSPDGSVFWVGYESGSIVRHRLSDGEWDSSTFSAVDQLASIRFIGETGRVAVARRGSSMTFNLFDVRKVDFATEYSAQKTEIDVSPSGLYALSPGYYKEGDETKSAEAVWYLPTQKASILFFEQTIGTTWLPDNRFLMWTEEEVSLWDPLIEENAETEVSERYVRRVFGTKRRIKWVKPSQDGTHAIVASASRDENNTVEMFDYVEIATGKVLANLEEDGFFLAESFHAFGSDLLLVKLEGKILGLDPGAVKVRYELTLPENLEAPLFLSEGGKFLIAVSKASIRKYDSRSGVLVGEIRLGNPSDFFYMSSFDERSSLLALAAGRKLAVFDTAKMSEVGTLDRPDLIEEIELVAVKNRLVVIDRTEQATIWDLGEFSPENRPRPLGSFVLMQDGSWLVMDRDGRYDAADPNKVTGASYVLEWEGGLEPVDIPQLKSLFYEPGLLAKLMGFDGEKPREVPDRRLIRLYPEVSIERSSRDPRRVSVTLQDRDEGGVGEVQVLMNGKVVDRRKGSGILSLNLDDYKAYYLPSSQLPEGVGNQLAVIASNKKGDLRSRPAVLDVGVPENLVAPEVNIYGLFVGISDYVGVKGDLSAPPMDALALEKALGDAAGRLLPGRVHMTSLVTSEGFNPTRDGILKWFEETAEKATSSDIVVVFFSGHGSSKIGNESGYYFLTSGANPQDVNPSYLGVHTVSGDDLRQALAKIPATKQVVILDTCHSGAAAGDLISDRASASDYIRAFESIRDASGTWLLAGSAADQLSYESRTVDHGLLTYSLLEAIDQVSVKGLRLSDGGDLFLDVQRWLEYGANRVESLRNETGVGGIQKPELRSGNANRSFDLGVTREQFRGSIGLKAPKPIVLMGTFDSDGTDPLDLEAQLGSALATEVGYKLWLNVAKHPKAFRVAGQYTEESGTIKLRLFIQRINEKMLRENVKVIELMGSRSDLPGLIEQIRKTVGVEIAKMRAASGETL